MLQEIIQLEVQNQIDQALSIISQSQILKNHESDKQQNDAYIIQMVQIRLCFIQNFQIKAYEQIEQLKQSLKKLPKEQYQEIKNHPNYQIQWAYVCLISDLHNFDKNKSVQNDILKKKIKNNLGQELEPKIYFIGDSHIFTFAHRYIQNKLAQPLLCVGLKAWHFQKKFENSPQIQQLVNHLKKFSNDSKIIFSAGEIDCRENEGILIALQKKIYSNIQEAVQNTVRIYINGIQSYIDQNFIQSQNIAIMNLVPPSNKQNPQRNQAIQLFNQFLKQECPSNIQLIDVYSQLVQYRANKKDEFFEFGMLQSKYRLDGTHVNPLVIEVIEKILQ